ncbi:MAG TPA: SDR family NAD(P)-dependent oxidoreductase, partial [Acidimicrobiales bacterium]
MAAPTLDFTGQVVVVTGGSRGVGAGIVRAFLSAGASVVTCGRNPVEIDGVTFVTADVRDPEQAAAVIKAAVDAHGRLDVLINNAGGSPKVMADVASPKFTESIIRLNLLAPIHCAQAAHSVMVTQESGGSIV